MLEYNDDKEEEYWLYGDDEDEDCAPLWLGIVLLLIVAGIAGGLVYFAVNLI